MVGIIIGSILSGVDVLTSLTGILLSGNLQFKCCCIEVSHKDTESELVQELKEVRRMSSPENKNMNES